MANKELGGHKAVDRKTETVKLQGNVEYAKVATRLVEFHSENSQCSIETDVKFESGGANMWVLVTASVTNNRGKFVAHSMQQFSGKAKFLEKLETVAVGRALAFAGYMASGEIASFEEMDLYEATITAAENRAEGTMLDALRKAVNENDLKAVESIAATASDMARMGTISKASGKAWEIRLEQAATEIREQLNENH